MVMREQKQLQDKAEAVIQQVGRVRRSSGTPVRAEAKRRENKELTVKDHSPSRQDSPTVYQCLCDLQGESILIYCLAPRDA